MREFIGVVVPIILLTGTASWIVLGLLSTLYAAWIMDLPLAKWSLGNALAAMVAFVVACLFSKWLLRVTEKR